LSLAFLSVFAGAIALLILVGKAIHRMVKGPTPSIAPTPPPPVLMTGSPRPPRRRWRGRLG